MDEVAFDYFERKYLKNPEANRKNVTEDSEFELTAKLYKVHDKVINEKKKEYFEFFPYSNKHYWVHKDVEREAVAKNTLPQYLKDFAVPIAILAAIMLSSGVYSAFTFTSPQTRSSTIKDTQPLIQGAGYRGKSLPLNIV